MGRASAIAVCGACVVTLVAPVPISAGQHAPTPQSGTLLAVPYLAQPPELCGGAALSMVFRYWGARDIFPTDFSPLIEKSEGGIRASVLTKSATDRGWQVVTRAAEPSTALNPILNEVAKGRPVIVLIEERVTRYHYVVVTGFTSTSVLVHDPARAPFRVIGREAFEREWDAAGRWLMVVVPREKEPDGGQGLQAGASQGLKPLASIPEPSLASIPELSLASIPGPPLASNGGGPIAENACVRMVREQVAHAKEGRLAEAEVGLEAATTVCPNEPSAWREFAGLRFVQRRYRESGELAERAAELDPSDKATAELLAGARFLDGQASSALDAWNQIGEPRVDTISIAGLRRTNQPVVVKHIRLEPRSLLTSGEFTQAERRMAELPSASDTRVTYQPSADGRAAINVVANERGLLPRGAIGWGVVGLHTGFRREIRLDLNGPFSEGDAWTFAYRFAARRPRGLLRIALPSRGPLPGITTVEAIWERESYEPLLVNQPPDVVPRRRVGVHVADWATGWLRWQVGAASERFNRARFVSIETRLTLRGLSDHAAAAFEVGRGLSTTRFVEHFSTTSLELSLRSRTRGTGPNWTATAGLKSVSDEAPPSVWPIAGSSDTRGVLLRAHPLLDDGLIRYEMLGRGLVHANVEYERPIVRRSLGRVSVAGFVDSARTTRPIAGATRRPQVDVGAGVRIDTPGIFGRLRLDLAHGLRDGRTAASAGIITEWGR